jgi:hypothetical protein
LFGLFTGWSVRSYFCMNLWRSHRISGVVVCVYIYIWCGGSMRMQETYLHAIWFLVERLCIWTTRNYHIHVITLVVSFNPVMSFSPPFTCSLHS